MKWKKATLVTMTVVGLILGFAIVCGIIPTSDDFPVRTALGVSVTMAWLWLVPNALRDDYDWVVGLLPIVFFSIVPEKAKFFLNGFAHPFVALFLGGLLVIPALEANGVALLIRCLIDRLCLRAIGTMTLVGICAAGTSTFLSNTIAATLFIPIADSAVHPFANGALRSRTRLVVAYAVTIGGIATIMGTPPNAITVKALAEQGIIVTSLEWMRIALPISVVLFGVMIGLVCIGGRLSTVRRVDTSRIGWSDLRPYLPRLIATLLIFASFVRVWILLEKQEWKAYQSYFWYAVPVSAFFLLLPVWRSHGEQRRRGLLAIRDIVCMRFGKRCFVVLVLAGGLALGEAMKLTHTDAWVADQIIPFAKPIALVSLLLFRLALAYPVVFLGEFVSNTALCSLLMPILMKMAALLREDQKELGIIMGIACSLGFMLLAATPPNSLCAGALSAQEESEYKRLMRQRGLLFDIVSVPIVVYLGSSLV